MGYCKIENKILAASLFHYDLILTSICRRGQCEEGQTRPAGSRECSLHPFRGHDLNIWTGFSIKLFFSTICFKHHLDLHWPTIAVKLWEEDARDGGRRRRWEWWGDKGAQAQVCLRCNIISILRMRVMSDEWEWWWDPLTKARFDEKIRSVLRTNNPAGWRWEDQSWRRRAPKTKPLSESSGNWEHVQIEN